MRRTFPSGPDPGIIVGRFEFLHILNVMWIEKARESDCQPIIVKLMDGYPGWIIPDFETRSDFLSRFRLVDRIVPEHFELPEGRLISPPEEDEIQSLMSSFIHASPSGKIFDSPQDLSDHLKSGNIDPMELTTTNGCFDILHPGHMKTLQEAHEIKGRLAVLINSDRSVRRFKGPERPIHDQKFRAALLSRLPFVDHVAVFDSDTVLPALDILRPGCHVKGGTFIVERIRDEQSLMAKWNGAFQRIPVHGSYSTSAILEVYQPGNFPV